MKSIVPILLCCMLSLFSTCSKNEEVKEDRFEATGIINGMDFRACPCCGGWILIIDDDPKTYRFTNLPENANIELNEFSQEPISVRFNWRLDHVCVSTNYVIIEAIQLD